MSRVSFRSFTSRRRFLGGALLLLCAPPLVGGACGSGDETGAGGKGAGGGDAGTGPQKIGPWEIPAGTVLEASRYAILCALMDAIIPGDAASPGATEAHAAWYLDQLLGAFRTDPPRIFAGGPNSGRHGGLPQFESFQPLTRVEELRWRTYLEGSQGLPEREWNGPVKGLRAVYEEGLDAVDALAQASFSKGFALLEIADRRGLVNSIDAELFSLVYGHAVEGTYGDPVYGGNFEQAGWKAIDYEGDRQPIGFSANEMAHPEEG